VDAETGSLALPCCGLRLAALQPIYFLLMLLLVWIEDGRKSLMCYRPDHHPIMSRGMKYVRMMCPCHLSTATESGMSRMDQHGTARNRAGRNGHCGVYYAIAALVSNQPLRRHALLALLRTTYSHSFRGADPASRRAIFSAERVAVCHNTASFSCNTSHAHK
jgi:hypothetical protein